MPRQRRLKLLTEHKELRPEVLLEENYGTTGPNNLEEWIDERIPPVPTGTLCEATRCVTQTTCGEEVNRRFCLQSYDHEGDHDFLGPHAQERPNAESYVWTVRDDHVCFTYVCYECLEAIAGDFDPADPGEYPTTDAGYAIAPAHCK